MSQDVPTKTESVELVEGCDTHDEFKPWCEFCFKPSPTRSGA